MYVSAFLSFVLAIPLLGQQATTQTASSSPQALALLQKSLAVLTGGQTVSDVTLSGSVRRIAGSDDDNGTAVLQALSSGAARTDLNLPSGLRRELENVSTTPTGAWSGPDGVSHSISFHNLLGEPAWFFPAFTIARRLANTNFIATYVGTETHNGQTVEHISVSQTPPFADPPGAPTFGHLTQVDFFLDSTTLLPAAFAFNIHPDNDMGLDLPIEVRFSDYRAVNGAQIPFHVQKFLNNSLILDFQVQSVTPNSGLSASTFSSL
jgi:hypothetical protein